MKLVEQQRTARPIPEILPQYFEYIDDESSPAEEETGDFAGTEAEATSMLTEAGLHPESVSDFEDDSSTEGSDLTSSSDSFDDGPIDEEAP